MAYTDIDKSDDYFNTVLYTGNGAVRDIVTGHATDFAWLKVRNTSGDHFLFDSVRGANDYIRSNRTDAEGTLVGTLTSFNSDGYSLGTQNATNTSGETQVGWSWVAGGAASSNTDGSITSSVSANTDAGFSVVSYTGNGTDNATVGHGLGIKPDCLIVKNRDDGADGWGYWNKGMGAETQQMALNMTNAAFTDDIFKSSSSTTVTLGIDTWSNVNTEKYIMYAFAEKQGYSKFGSYTGNGSTSDGIFIYTGFKPAFMISKRTDSGDEWNLHDSKRPEYNPTNKYLQPNSSAAEGERTIDFLSNGIKLYTANAGYNASGGNYIYMAFAENPFVTSTGVPATAR
jgi:hypothetical protein